MSHTFLCICCEFKGDDFIKSLHQHGQKVFLVTSEKTKNDPWPRECLEDIFFIPGDDGRDWNMDELINGTAYLFRRAHIDKIIALDDYDVWKASVLREEFRSPGMGHTTSRHFFDKLAMRMKAQEGNITIPKFSGLFNNEKIHKFLENSNGPWIIKPRMDAGAIGLRKMQHKDDVWQWCSENEEIKHGYLIEEFKPGDVYHVDTLITDYKADYCRSSRYLDTPFEVAHGGGIFRSQTLDIKDKDHKYLEKFNNQLIKHFGLKFGASHSEFIKCHEDGKFYFLETSARVGGAHLAEMNEMASGINLWEEWAKIEMAMLDNTSYSLPKQKKENAGILVTLSNRETMDYSSFTDPNICWTLDKKWHVGMIFNNELTEKVKILLDEHTKVILQDYHNSIPLKE